MKYSVTEYLAQFLAHNPKHVFTVFCECKKCKNLNWVKLSSQQIPEIMTNLGFDDLLTLADFKRLKHAIVQSTTTTN